jgi:hypothetical protein
MEYSEENSEKFTSRETSAWVIVLKYSLERQNVKVWKRLN